MHHCEALASKTNTAQSQRLHPAINRILLCVEELFTESLPTLNRVLWICALATPLYISAALKDYWDNDVRRAEYMHNLVYQISRWGLDSSPDINFFTWMLIHEEPETDMASLKRPWFVARMLAVLRRSSTQSQCLVRCLFLKFLIGKLDVHGMQSLLDAAQCERMLRAESNASI